MSKQAAALGSRNINNFISCHTHPRWGSPIVARWTPVVHFSHFLVSNVQSKFYRLLLPVFFFNQITKLKFSLFACCWCWCCVCHEIVRLPFFFHHTRRNVVKTDFSVISTSNKLQKYFSYRHRIFTSSAQVKKIRKLWFLKNSLRHQLGVDGAGTWEALM